jgi:hypothetical protein
MDKTAIKNYAVVARRKLIEAVRQKAFQYYVFEDGALSAGEVYNRLRADGVFLTSEQDKARLNLCNELAMLGKDLDNVRAYQHVMEEVAYTWFNRLIALRFMEVNDYLPSGIRVLSSMDKGRIEPDAMREAERLAYVDQTIIAELLADTKPSASDRLYKYILISQCNALADILPGMFEKIVDYTELLLPDALYTKGGIVYDLVNAIDEEDFRDQVQIIGWLYQYYISEKKDEVFAALKNNIKLNKETIPAATQLFTPEWIVKYMVENSLGRLWLEHEQANAGLTDEYLNGSFFGWKYYIEEAEQEPGVQQQLAIIREERKFMKPEDIKLIDPCMGSGHILVYAFDVLYQIYACQGYAERDIPNLILQHNIYGLDIDGRAAQLAYFALMMKARSYSRRFFRQENIPHPHVHAIIESDGAELLHMDYMGYDMSKADQNECREELAYLIDLFADAREYGSILKIEKALDYEKLRRFVKAVQLGQLDIYSDGIEKAERVLLEVLDTAENLTLKYDVVVTNPPYMGSSGMGGKLSEYVKKEYPDSKSDMFAVFIEKCGDMLKPAGLQAMITQHAWMFLTSYEKLRAKIMRRDILNMAHLGARAFEEIGGEVVQTTTFVLRSHDIAGYEATYARLVEYSSQTAKEEAFLRGENRFAARKENFEKIPGAPTAYWVDEKLFSAFSNNKLHEIANVKTGLQTGDNNQFLRIWYEVKLNDINFPPNVGSFFKERWYPYLKGGAFRKWYGNIENIILWEDNGREVKAHKGSIIRNPDYYFTEGLTWSGISTTGGAFRFTDAGYIFDSNKGPMIFEENIDITYILGVLNSIITPTVISVLNPTISLQISDVQSIPIIFSEKVSTLVQELVAQNISVSRTDWNSFETSWDFKTHPLVAFKGNYEESVPLLYADDLVEGINVVEWSKVSAPIAQAFDAWERFTDEQFVKLKSNEEELNRIFIEIYGLQVELTPEVEDKDVTIRKADRGRDIRSFLSYAVGCMFGRYSLDEPGLVFAGGQLDILRYKTFLSDEDNILPIGSADYFEDDIAVRFTEFVRAVYGGDVLDENLNFIADALYPNGNGSAKERIRRYFLNDFYKDHVKVYQKRPIYWLLDSGKKDGFKALFYLHRYDKYIIARVRTDYLHPLQRKYESEIGRLEMLSASVENAYEKAAYRKEVESLRAKIVECSIYDQVVAHIAHQHIELDLDDGVKVNYAKFQSVEVPRDNGKFDMMDLLAKI